MGSLIQIILIITLVLVHRGGATTSYALNDRDGRLTSANVNLAGATYKNKMTMMLASSSMTEGKPPADAHILSFGWDSDAGYGAQLAIRDPSDGISNLYIRGTKTSGSTNTLKDVPWATVLDSNNYTTYAATKGHTHDINTLINTLGTGTATPQDADYYICQTAGGGSSNLTYARRSTSSLWTYIKGKADSVYQPKGSYAAASHTHNSVLDSNNNAITTFAYSKAGLNYADFTWIAAWNGQELRAVNKNQFATAGHTHDMMTNAEIDALFT